jgi:hypothetical protein
MKHKTGKKNKTKDPTTRTLETIKRDGYWMISKMGTA